MIDKDKRIVELENEIKKKDELIKQLGESNKFLSSDKAVSTEQVKQIAREVQLKVMKENIEIVYSTIRHEICEKIREEANEISFWDCESDCRIIEKDEFDEILNKIEQGE